ncbi:MAG: formate dehydrogenase accessory sulfurtransferase FdhD [Flavobacteriales bacterium]|nr:formate dehydrogenase accessory sulfurtransferase FdhD [Flavobacteriales bacterium]
MKPTLYQGNKIDKQTIQQVEDALTNEEALQINLNGKAFSLTMRSPGNDDELIRGLLYSEDVYRGQEPLQIKYSKAKDSIITEANIQIDESLIREGYSNSRNFLSASSCGICGKTELESFDQACQLETNNQLDINLLEPMFREMKSRQTTFHQTGGSHAAAAFTAAGELLCVMEDIGRHNAVDKVVGHLINHNQLNQAFCLTVSGRISYEIVSKAFAAKIPVLAAVSAPSSLAVDFSKELGISLLAFCRNDKATCYAHPERLTITSGA